MVVETTELLRSCGECTACCFTHEVGELQKGCFTKCIHSGNGCAVYATRPRACGSYFCAWLLNEIGTDEERPDKLGVVCNIEHTPLRTGEPKAMLLMEVRPGALEEPPVRALILRTLRTGMLVITGSKLHQPEYQHHVMTDTCAEAHGETLELKGISVVWHEYTKGVAH